MINGKYFTFMIFLFLTAIWSSFFSAVKYFLLGDLNLIIQNLDMQILAGYLSFGSIFAYLIGGALASTFLKKYLLFYLSFFSLVFLFLAYNIGIDSRWFLGFTLSFIGFFYGLWTILKNIIVSIEISKTGLSSTKVNSYISIVFISFLLIGNTFGSILFERFGHEGYFFLMIMLVLTSLLSFLLDYDISTLRGLFKHGFKSYYYERKNTFMQSMLLYIPEIKYVIKNYSLIMIVSSILWSVSTIVSQESVNFSVINYKMLTSDATFILMYFTIGTIFGSLFL